MNTANLATTKRRLMAMARLAATAVLSAAPLVAAGCSGSAEAAHDSGTVNHAPDGQADQDATVQPRQSASDAGVDSGATCGTGAMRPGSPCFSAGFGACINMGTVVCADASVAVCAAAAGTADENFHASSAANGSWDWNCNNNVDRKYPLAACEAFSSGNCPAHGWRPKPGESGDCGEQLIQQSCSATGAGCVSTGSEDPVTEECK